jgi:hypothetical protein
MSRRIYTTTVQTTSGAHAVIFLSRYTWIERYVKHGPLGLEKRSRTPHSRPHQTPGHMLNAGIELRRH